jgi:hypothetical protein
MREATPDESAPSSVAERIARPPFGRRVATVAGGFASSRRWIAWACAAAALVLGALAANIAEGPHGSVSTLVHVAGTDPLAPLIRAEDPGFDFVPTGSHYDGTYYYAIARDPFAHGAAHTRIDLAAKRYGHAFYGQLAGVLSLGDAWRVPLALLVLSLAALAVAAFCASRIAEALGWSPWAGLVVGLSPGLIYATTVDTAEPLEAALIGLALLAWQRRRLGLAAVAFVALSLTKEPMSLVPLGVLLYETVRIWRRDGRAAVLSWPLDRLRARVLAVLLIGPVTLFAWSQYVQHRFGSLPLSGNSDASTFPFTGIVDTLRAAGRLGSQDFASAQIGAVTIPLVLVLVAALIAGLVVALRLRTVLDGVFLATAPLMFILSPPNLLYPKDLLRLTVIPLLILPAVLAGARRRHGASVEPAGGGAQQQDERHSGGDRGHAHERDDEPDRRRVVTQD